MMKKKILLLLLIVMGTTYCMDAPLGAIQIASSGKKLSLQDTGLKASSLLFNPTSNQLAIAHEKEVRLYIFMPEGKIEKTNLIYPHRREVRDMSFDCSGQFLATCQYGSSHADIYSTINPRRAGPAIDTKGKLFNTRFHPKKPILLLVSQCQLAKCFLDENGVAEKREKKDMNLSRQDFLNFCSTGEYFILHELYNHQLVRYVIEPQIELDHTFSFSADNIYLDSTNNRLCIDIPSSKGVQVYDVDQKKDLCVLHYNCSYEDDFIIQQSGAAVTAMNFDTTGKYLAVGFHKKNRFIVYDVELQKIIHEYESELGGRVIQILFSHNGKFLILLTKSHFMETTGTVLTVELPQL